ncbi:AAA family ATPase [Rheinheimera metallidurans]|uniref:AAA family ATPase n=1 Tax=Rheinheimera metallidurans TaxID=2925781 RepID=UPI0030030582
MKFKIIKKDVKFPTSGLNELYLTVDFWNDFSFVTQFYLSFYDSSGTYHDIGNIKIGFVGQTTEVSTYEKLTPEFVDLPSNFFSLGEGPDFYKKIVKLGDVGKRILKSLNDIVHNIEVIDLIKEEKVFSDSFLRNTSLSVIKGQYARILSGGTTLTDYDFKFMRNRSENFGGLSLSFNVRVGARPTTNIHAIIGRNGVGKTTILNGMIEAITNLGATDARFKQTLGFRDVDIDESYFSSLVSVSFSAFDPFVPPPEQSDPAKGTCYFYIGLKDPKNSGLHRNISDLHDDCVVALTRCFHNPLKAKRWHSAINKLGSDDNFASMALSYLEVAFHELKKSSKKQSDSDEFKREFKSLISTYLNRMSSGHAIVLLTITRLVSVVEEKTLVLLDEPESHLHPPLLSAFIRALSELLLDQNGVSIIATHSPVVLQEVPKSCVWKIYRKGENVTASRPNIETFAENVGVLTSEVFNLEVERSGFHDILENSVRSGKTYEEILAEYDKQIGFEGRAILKVLIAKRERES